LDYSKTLDYLFKKLPIYQKEGKKAYKPGLDRIKALLQALGNPEQGLRYIHVAGTNGKGSTCTMLAHLLKDQGYSVGLYTSPHLVDYRERIKINNQNISKEAVVAFVNEINPLIEQIEPSFFEITVAMSFWYFSTQKTEIAIIETGLGGRLDSTNVIHPTLSIITNISLDHQAILGNSLGEIAEEKAGIIKENTPVLIGRKQPETRTVFRQKSIKMNSPLTYSNDYPKQPYALFKTAYQQENSQTAYAALQLLKKEGLIIKEEKIKHTFKTLVKTAFILGRWHELKKNTTIILDTAHNQEGVTHSMQQLVKKTYDTLHIVWGMVADKDSDNILCLLPKKAQYYFCMPNVIRGKKTSVLEQEALSHKLKGKVFSCVKEAILAAQKAAKQKDIIFIGGSTFVVGEAYETTFTDYLF